MKLSRYMSIGNVKIIKKSTNDISCQIAKPSVIIRFYSVTNIYMKAYADGMRSLFYYTAYLFDKVKIEETKEEKEKYQGLIELLTPVTKSLQEPSVAVVKDNYPISNDHRP